MKINWLHVVNTLAGAAAVVGGLSPALFGPYAPQAALAIGGATILANVLHASITPASGAPVTVSPSVKALLTTAVLVGVMGATLTLSACKTAPTATQSAGITVAIDIAAGAAIQSGTSDSAVWVVRAKNFKAIAVEIKQVNDAGTATLATLAADLSPLIAKLPPTDQLAAHTLVAALTPYLNQELQGNQQLQTAQATVDVVLQAIIDSCGAYGA